MAGSGEHLGQEIGGHGARRCAATIAETRARFAAVRHSALHGGHILQLSGMSAQSLSRVQLRAALRGSSGRGGYHTSFAGGGLSAVTVVSLAGAASNAAELAAGEVCSAAELAARGAAEDGPMVVIAGAWGETVRGRALSSARLHAPSAALMTASATHAKERIM